MPEYSEDELAGLSEEERAAIMDNDDMDESVGPDDDEPEVIEPEEELPEPEKPEPEKVEPEPEVETEPDPKPEKVVEPERPVEKSKPISVKLPDEVAEGFKAEQEALNTKYENGDIGLSELLDERDRINRRVFNAETEQAEKAAAANSWQEAQNRFFADNKQYATDTERYNNLNACVKAVANANSGSSLEAILAKAKRMEEAMSGVVEAPAPKLEVKKVLPKSPKPEVPNLGDLPASAPNSVDEGEFSALDKLTGLEYEAAIAKLSPAQAERYFKG